VTEIDVLDYTGWENFAISDVAAERTASYQLAASPDRCMLSAAQRRAIVRLGLPTF